MPEYDRFNSLARYIEKNAGNKNGKQTITDLHNAFVSCVPELPEDLKHDIAYYFEETYARENAEHSASLYAMKLNEVLYLFELEYERVEETFSREDWEYFKNVVDDFALEIDQERLTYIMRKITSRGIIGR